MERSSVKICILFSILAAAVLSCDGSQINSDESLVKAVSGTWQGTIPCADCPGIEYELSLKSNHTFIERSVYLEEHVNPFIEKGQWEINKDSIITLGKEGEGMRYFKFTGEALKMLDTQKQPITTGLAKFYILKKRPKMNEELD